MKAIITKEDVRTEDGQFICGWMPTTTGKVACSASQYDLGFGAETLEVRTAVTELIASLYQSWKAFNKI